ncbi:MAG TPA: 3'-5' exonuclease, partial [Chlamydiales bacterium]|nr:3'-5' exonuclease [Chlamydiales bacterium]
AAEMRHRVESLIGSHLAKTVTLSTFHSFCMQILRKEIEKLGYTKDFSLYDERDLHRIIAQIARELLGHEGELPSLAPTLAAMSRASNGDATTWHDQFSQDLFKRLQSTLRAYNAVSFDHLITLAIKLFEEEKSVLEKYQERYRYIMIDEYQDTNPAQFRLAELLCAKYQNLCVVGDDDQSIYGWRGAEIKNILHFKADCVVKLEQNYRSTSTILEAANAVIGHNKNRHRKNLWSIDKSSAPIEVFHAPTEAEEAQAIVQRLLHYRESKGLKWKEMAILYRSNSLSRTLEMALMAAPWQKNGNWVRGIPYEVFGGLEFSERSEIKDLLAYLRVIANPKDQEALLRILNVPRRGVSDTLLDQLTQENRTQEIPLWQLLTQIATGEKSLAGHPKGTVGIRTFVHLIEKAQGRFSSGSLSEAMTWLVEEINYKKAIEEEVKSDKMRDFKWENVQECINALAQYEQEEEEPSLQHFVANTALGKQTFAASGQKAGEDKVQLMTLHSAKGLEFLAVFIVGLEDHILPHEKSAAEGGIEEERRLFYVGITRARKYLTLSMARSRLRCGKANPTTPSRFLHEIPSSLFKAVSPKFIV